MAVDTQTLRILDAQSNRANEGLRVVEDYVRFVLDDAHLTQLLKQLRHELAEACAALPLADRHAARDTQHDVGTEITTSTEATRGDAWDVCVANLERVKQSLRSLEEYGKLVDTEFAQRIESHRYEFYTIERCLGLTVTSRLRLRGANLCVLLDGRESESALVELVRELLNAGVAMFQLRDKRLGDAELIARGRLLRSMIPRQGNGAMLIVNDRPDVAATIDADGVHLGQNDMGIADARKIVGPRRLIGVSTHSIEQARQAVVDGADYLGAGPTFPSSTKSFDDFPGLPFLKQVAGEIRLPTFAIGGIDAENIDAVLATGVGRVAVSGAVWNSAKPQAVVQELLEQLASRPAG